MLDEIALATTVYEEDCCFCCALVQRSALLDTGTTKKKIRGHEIFQCKSVNNRQEVSFGSRVVFN